MTTHVKDVTADTSSKAEETLAELRKSVTEITKDLSKIVDQRARQVQAGAQAGADSLRRTIRRQPIVSIGAATLGGALIALLVVPRFGSGRAPKTRWDAWTPNWAPPSVTRADLHDFAEGIQRSVSRAAHSVPLSSSLERLLEAVNKVEPGSALNGLAEKAGTWFRSAKSAAEAKVKG